MRVELLDVQGCVLGAENCDVAVFTCGKEALLRVTHVDVLITKPGILHCLKVAQGHVVLGDGQGNRVFLDVGKRVQIPAGMHALVVG